LATHAKRVTLKVDDIRLLRQLWKTIDPSSALGADSPKKKEWIEAKNQEMMKDQDARIRRMRRKITKLKAIGRLDRMTAGDRAFCELHHLSMA
jgi:hypothetical protein